MNLQHTEWDRAMSIIRRLRSLPKSRTCTRNVASVTHAPTAHSERTTTWGYAVGFCSIGV